VGDGVELGGFQGLVEGEGREDGGQALGQHGLPRAWRPDEKHVRSRLAVELDEIERRHAEESADQVGIVKWSALFERAAILFAICLRSALNK
jgi:hypothetical protein